MKTILAMMTLVFMTSTVSMAAPEGMPFSHMQAVATANQINRLKTVGNYTKWIANRVPKDQMSAYTAFLKSKGLKPSTTFPKMTADGPKACFDKAHCITYAGDSASVNGVNFKVEKKPYGKLMNDICAKIGCASAKSAQLSLIPEAHAFLNMNKTTTSLLGIALGGAIGYFAGDRMGNPALGMVAGAGLGGLAGYFLGSEDKAVCNGNCQVSCNNDQYYMTPTPQPSQPYYGQQNPPYHMNQQAMYHQYGQNPPPCQYQGQPTNGQTDLQMALNQPPQQSYCPNTGCNQYQPYTPGQPYNPGGDQFQGQPADVRTVSSEKKPEVKKEEKKKDE